MPKNRVLPSGKDAQISSLGNESVFSATNNIWSFPATRNQYSRIRQSQAPVQRMHNQTPIDASFAAPEHLYTLPMCPKWVLCTLPPFRIIFDITVHPCCHCVLLCTLRRRHGTADQAPRSSCKISSPKVATHVTARLNVP